MSTEPATRMHFAFTPGTETKEWINSDVAPHLLHDKTFITALTQGAFSTQTIVAMTGVFAGIEIPVTPITGATATGSMYFDAGNYLNIFNGTAWKKVQLS